MALEHIFSIWEITNAYNYLMFWWTNAAQTLSISGCGDVPACHCLSDDQLWSWPVASSLPVAGLSIRGTFKKQCWKRLESQMSSHITQGAVGLLAKRRISYSLPGHQQFGRCQSWWKGQLAGLKDSCVTGSFILVHFLIQLTLLFSRWPGDLFQVINTMDVINFSKVIWELLPQKCQENSFIERDPQYVWWQVPMLILRCLKVCPMPNLPISYAVWYVMHCQEPTKISL